MTPASLVRVQMRPPPGGIRTLFGRAPAAEVMDVRGGDLRVLPTRRDRSCPARTAHRRCRGPRRGPVGVPIPSGPDASCRSGLRDPERLGRGGHLGRPWQLNRRSVFNKAGVSTDHRGVRSPRCPLQDGLWPVAFLSSWHLVASRRLPRTGAGCANGLAARYDVAGHAADHLQSATPVFPMVFLSAVLVWALPGRGRRDLLRAAAWRGHRQLPARAGGQRAGDRRHRWRNLE